MAGAMGGACMIGLGLALARRDKRVLVVTGDGELLMNIGALATIAVLNPPNLVDRRASTTATTARPATRRATPASGVDLEKIAAGSGIKRTRTIEQRGRASPTGTRMLREGNGTAFVLLRVKPSRAARGTSAT